MSQAKLLPVDSKQYMPLLNDAIGKFENVLKLNAHHDEVYQFLAKALLMKAALVPTESSYRALAPILTRALQFNVHIDLQPFVLFFFFFLFLTP
jgi:hypothetical protein